MGCTVMPLLRKGLPCMLHSCLFGHVTLICDIENKGYLSLM